LTGAPRSASARRGSATATHAPAPTRRRDSEPSPFSVCIERQRMAWRSTQISAPHSSQSVALVGRCWACPEDLLLTRAQLPALLRVRPGKCTCPNYPNRPRPDRVVAGSGSLPVWSPAGRRPHPSFPSPTSLAKWQRHSSFVQVSFVQVELASSCMTMNVW
jgi:hypothetical protein